MPNRNSNKSPIYLIWSDFRMRSFRESPAALLGDLCYVNGINIGVNHIFSRCPSCNKGALLIYCHVTCQLLVQPKYQHIQSLILICYPNSSCYFGCLLIARIPGSPIVLSYLIIEYGRKCLQRRHSVIPLGPPKSKSKKVGMQSLTSSHLHTIFRLIAISKIRAWPKHESYSLINALSVAWN